MQNRIYYFLFIVLLVARCGLETKTLPEFYGGDFEKITKIEILNGTTGYKKTVKDKKVIDAFLNELKGIKFIPEANQEKRVGYRYSITFFEDGKKTFHFTSIQINDDYYYTEPDIHPILDRFYEYLDEPATISLE